MLKRTVKSILFAIKVSVAAVLMMIFSLSATEIKKSLDKELNEKYVYKVLYRKKGFKIETPGATAFLVEAPSGKTYVLTNRHVCQNDSKSAAVGLLDSDGKRHPMKIIEMSKIYDLCLVEAPKGKSGIKVSKNISVGETIFYLGFPRGQDATITYGDVVGHDVVTITLGYIPYTISKKDCLSSKDTSVQPLEYQGLKFHVCYMTHKALVSTLFIYGGASGSPVLNKYHELVGVVYSAPQDGGWGWAMPLSAIKDFLKGR